MKRKKLKMHLAFLLVLPLLATAYSYSWATERLSVSSSEIQGNKLSGVSAMTNHIISDDGRYVAFYSTATNLVPGTGFAYELYLRDRLLGTTELISVGNNGERKGGISLSVSSDGRFVAFTSYGSYSALDADGNGADVYLRDRLTGTTEFLSGNPVSPYAEITSPSISDDGRYVAFSCDRKLCIRDRQTSTTERPNIDVMNNVAMDGYGRYIAYYKWYSSTRSDIYRYDRQTGANELVACVNNEQQPKISKDGRYVIFASKCITDPPYYPTSNTNVYVKDMQTAAIEIISVDSNENREPSGYNSDGGSISDDGRFAAFGSPGIFTANDYPGGWDVFVRDRLTGNTALVSATSGGSAGNGQSQSPFISGDGRYIAFQSQASNLVAGDTNGVADEFIAVSPFAPPVADAGVDQNICASGSADVTLNGSASYDLNGRGLTYNWSGPVPVEPVATPIVSLIPGTYTFTLTVDNGAGGTSADTIDISIYANTAPVTSAHISGSFDNNSCVYGFTINLSSIGGCLGVKEIHFIINGFETIVSGSTASINLTEAGTYTISYWAADNSTPANIEGQKTLTIGL